MSVPPPASGGSSLINEFLTDDRLRAVLTRLGPKAERDAFGLMCRRWPRIQSPKRRRLHASARTCCAASPHSFLESLSSTSHNRPPAPSTQGSSTMTSTLSTPASATYASSRCRIAKVREGRDSMLLHRHRSCASGASVSVATLTMDGPLITVFKLLQKGLWFSGNGLHPSLAMRGTEDEGRNCSSAASVDGG